MAKPFAFANYFNFIHGLNTDLSIFNTKPTECIDIKNIKLNSNGSIEIRKGFQYISDYVYSFNSDREYYVIPLYWQVYSKKGDLFKYFVIVNKNQLHIFNNILSTPLYTLNYIISKGVTKTTQTVNYGDSTTSIDDKVVSTETTVTITGRVPFNDFTTSFDGNFLAVFSDTNFPNIIYFDENNTVKIEGVVPLIRNNNDSTETSIIEPAYTTNFPSVGAFAFGRAWYAGEKTKPNRVLFSQVYTGDILSYSKCYQENSPYDPKDPDIVATDGGEIYISGADNIIGLLEYKGSLLVFATNGVWEIKGGTGGFSATDFEINKISDIGCCSRKGYVLAENVVCYVSYNGIYLIIPDEITGRLKIASITENKINNLYASIPIANRENLNLFYNKDTKELYVFCNINSSQVIEEGYYSHYNNILIFNFRLKAWYVYSMNEEINTSKYRINSVLSYPTVREAISLVDNSGNSLITNDGSEVSLYSYTSDTAFEPILLLSKYDSINNKTLIKLAYFETEDIIDFKDTEDEEYYDAYIVSSHQLYNDVARRKSNSYLYVALKRVDTGVTNDLGTDLHPQDLLYRVGFDFVEAPKYVTDKFGETYVANSKYGKFRKLIPAKLPESYTTKSYIIIPVKVLGSGKALQFEFKNRIDKRAFKCLANNVTSSPLIDETNWEEVEYNEAYSKWDSNTIYNTGDYVKVIIVYDFNIQGWATELIPNTKSSGVV